MKALIPEAVKRGYKNIARIGTQQDGVLAINDAFDRENRDRLKILVDEQYPPDVKDFRTFISKVKQRSEMDGVLAILLPGQLGVFAKQARELGLTIPLFGVEIFEVPDEVKASNGALIGQWYVNADDPSGDFIEEYKKRYPNASSYLAANGHDAMLLIGTAIQRGVRPQDISQFLHVVKDFTGALGTFSASGDNRFTLPATVKQVTKDGFEKVSAK